MEPEAKTEQVEPTAVETTNNKNEIEALKKDIDILKSQVCTLYTLALGALVFVLALSLIVGNSLDKKTDFIAEIHDLYDKSLLSTIIPLGNQNEIVFRYEISSNTLIPHNHFEFWECINDLRGSNMDYIGICISANKLEKKKIVGIDLLYTNIRHTKSIKLPKK